MTRGIYIIGTDTEVGKSVIAAGLMATLIQRGYRAAYFKPISSGQTQDENGFHPADAFFVRHISGFDEKEEIISPFAYYHAVAPHLAARWEQNPVSVPRIKNNLNYLKERYEIIIAEAAGGIAVPLNDHGLMQYELIRELRFSCALVTRAGLGTINHTLLTLSFASKEQLEVTSIFINQYTGAPLEVENIEVIRRWSNVENIYVVPALETLDRYSLINAFNNILNSKDLDNILKPLPD
ncbi:MAG: dethiobiotin synthase [Syntrophales bacterium]|nr:dethiobiotin synthase [Syntrophales bacterium]